MNYDSCIKKYIDLLPSLPKNWAEMIACNICNMICEDGMSCGEIRDCQTLTTLSDFTVTDTSVCFTYVDERQVRVTRCFDIAKATNGISETDGQCLLEDSELDWGALTPTAQWQAIIDKICDCCNPTTTTSTSSTTTTTTIPECVCATFSLYNPNLESEPTEFDYTDCEGAPALGTVAAGETEYICACDGTLIFPDTLIMGYHGLGCVQCHCYTITNLEEEQGVVNYGFKYVPCDTLEETEMALGIGQSVSLCIIQGTIITNFANTIDDLGECQIDCPPTTTTTTTL